MDTITSAMERTNMPVIRLSDETWERLKKWAIPLEDTADMVVNRILDIADHSCEAGESSGVTPEIHRSDTSKRHVTLSARGQKVPQEAFRQPILESLYELGGKGPTKVVLGRVEEKMKDILGPYDYEHLRSGDMRWWKSANWQRHVMMKEGLLRGNSPRGVWELSKEGIEAVESRSP